MTEMIETAIREVMKRQADALTTPATDLARFKADLGAEIAAGSAARTEIDGQHQLNGSQRGEARGGGRLLLVAAAALVTAGIGVGLAFVPGRGQDSVSTDLSPTTSAIPTSTVPPATTTSLGPASTSSIAPPAAIADPADVPRLLPDTERWVMISNEVSELAPGGNSSLDTYVFELQQRTYILTVQPAGLSGDEMPTEPQPEALANRVSAYWRVSEEVLGLTSFDLTIKDFQAIADSLVVAGGVWSIPGANVTLAEVGETPRPEIQVRSEFAPVDDAGLPALSRTVVQVSSPRTLGSLYSELGEASSLGDTAARSIVGAPGFHVSGSAPEYGLRYADGWVTSWQSTAGFGDLGAFLDTLSPADDASWSAATERAVSIRADTIAAATAKGGPIPAQLLPRLLLPSPWQLTDVYDESQWTDEERGLSRARSEANVQPSDYNTLWAQSFRREGNQRAALPDVMVEVHEVLITYPSSPIGPDSKTFSLGGFEGVLGLPSQGTAYISMTRDDTRYEIFSPTLTPAELGRFVTDTGLRSASGVDGLDVDGADIQLSAEGSLSLFRDRYTPGWSTSWTSPAGDIHMQFVGVPTDSAELLLDLQASWEAWPTHEMTRSATNGLLLRIDGGYEPTVIWARPDLGGQITINGSGAFAAADVLAEVSEQDWVDAVRPFIKPPVLGPGN